jgi:hypothetical protein
MSYTGFLDTIPNPQQPTGGSGDQIFFENGQTVTSNYTVTTGSNAGTFGPITVNSGVTVTIPSGSTWSIV